MLERFLPISLLLLALVGAPVMILAPEGLPRLRGVEREIESVERENAALRREIDVLRARVSRLRDDPAAVEQLARDELGLVRQSEVVFQFPAER
ncbi:MAG: septum formation initiator family protein [Deltaproteobacteria bacterium]|nr:septum formation initiator family protein [Deltaproteobacteria bacterium]